MPDQAEKTREILRKVQQVEIRSRKFVTESLVGAYHSVFKGQGMEFAEVREYIPGDDVRRIDWNVTARNGRPFVKLFEEERELTILLVVDVSASGDFGSVATSKRELAAELASVLAFSATRNNDKVGAVLFSDEVETFIAPKKGRQHVLRLIRDILFHEPQGRGTDIPGVLRRVNRLLHRKAVVFLISDFLTPETLAWIRPSTGPKDALEQSLALTANRHDLVCIPLSDPRERELPDVGLVTLEDAETGEQLELDTSNKKIRQLYAAQNTRRLESLRTMLRQRGIDAIEVSTDQPYIEALRAFFTKRGARR